MIQATLNDQASASWSVGAECDPDIWIHHNELEDLKDYITSLVHTPFGTTIQTPHSTSALQPIYAAANALVMRGVTAERALMALNSSQPHRRIPTRSTHDTDVAVQEHLKRTEVELSSLKKQVIELKTEVLHATTMSRIDTMDTREAIRQVHQQGARDDVPPDRSLELEAELEAARAEVSILRVDLYREKTHLEEVDDIVKAALDGDFASAALKEGFEADSEDLSTKQKAISLVWFCSEVGKIMTHIKDISVRANPRAAKTTKRSGDAGNSSAWERMSLDAQDLIQNVTGALEAQESLELMHAAISEIRSGRLDPDGWTRRLKKDRKTRHIADRPFDASVLALGNSLTHFIENYSSVMHSMKASIYNERIDVNAHGLGNHFRVLAVDTNETLDLLEQRLLHRRMTLDPSPWRGSSSIYRKSKKLAPQGWTTKRR
ncbi:hypothetical protein FRB93_007195 [Tulasnella sp. JGI-2019a]|nr:hypothetical protein FRB93_007195 [Tulasnella sp. JGI-2019a]